MHKAMAMVAVLGLAGAAQADILISEILGSTESTDREYIEIVNTGNTAIDITGWAIELWDSDAGGSFGGADGGSPYVLVGAGMLNPGQVYTIGNVAAQAAYSNPPFSFNAPLQDNAIENSSYTAILVDAFSNIIDAVFVTDGGAGDAANRAGAAIAASLTVGPDGTFLPAGFARTDTVGGWSLLAFAYADQADGSIFGGTPGINQIPTPGAMALLGLGGMVATRRRR